MDAVTEQAPRPEAYSSQRGSTHAFVPVRAIVTGVLAAALLLAVYMGLITLAQGWSHATDQLAIDRWYIAAIALGFGTQIALFTWLRWLHASAMAAGGVAASTGTSAAAMLACCAHHVADVLPLIGLSGAAIFLNDYKTELLWLGITMNAIGVGYLLMQIRTARLHIVAQCSAMAAHQGMRIGQ